VADTVDLLILGSGSTAFAAALTAQDLNKSAVMTEQRPIGGTCVNRGCLPSQNLIEAARILHEASNPRYPGLAPSAIAFDFAALVAQKDEVIHEYRKKKYESLIGGRIQIAKGHVRFTDPHSVEVDGKRFSGDSVLIATGSRPVLPSNRRLGPGPLSHE
jgi:mercuric reductase